MNSENAAQIHASRQLEALMVEIYKAEDRRKKQRREREDDRRDSGNGGKKHFLALLFILVILISAVTSLAIAFTYCGFVLFEWASF